MKKLGITLLAVCFSVLINAKNHSKLIIDINSNREMVVWINGTQFFTSSGFIEIENLMPGDHLVKIATKPDFRTCGQQSRVLFNGRIKILPNSITNASLDHFGYTKIEHIRIDNYCNMIQNTGVVTCENGIMPSHFNTMLHQIENESFDSSKLKLAKLIVLTNRLTSVQVKQITDTFTFECSRLAFAKFAHDKVIDPHNYFKVIDSFTFSSSKNELLEFINGY